MPIPIPEEYRRYGEAHLKLKRPFSSILLVLLIISCGSDNRRLPERDVTLVVPGSMAEGVLIGEKPSLSGGVIMIENPDETPLSEILKNGEIPRFNYNRIAYERNRYALFLDGDSVAAIAVLSINNRVTDDAVNLSEGIDNLILNYGNEGLKIINDGEHRIYIYRSRGIALFDDYGDGLINMYLIFRPEK